jgi:hypothetical protein
MARDPQPQPIYLDIDALRPGSLGASARVRHVLLLVNDRGRAPGSGSQPERELGISVNRSDPRLIEAARRIDGVDNVWTTVEYGHPVIWLTAWRRMAALAAFEQLCREYQVLILDVIKRPLDTPAFDQQPELVPIPNSVAVMGLIRQFQPGHQSALLAQCGPAQLFVELAANLDAAACYKLRQGDLAETVKLVSTLSPLG